MKKKEGFSLIEVIIATFLLFVVLLSISGLFIQSLTMVYEAKMRSRASQLAQQKYDYLNSVGRKNFTDFVLYKEPYEDMASNGTDSVVITMPYDSFPGLDGKFKRVTTVVNQFNGVANIIHTSIDVYWRNLRGDVKHINMTFLLQENR